jgi:hypothetical protein
MRRLHEQERSARTFAVHLGPGDIASWARACSCFLGVQGELAGEEQGRAGDDTTVELGVLPTWAGLLCFEIVFFVTFVLRRGVLAAGRGGALAGVLRLCFIL